MKTVIIVAKDNQNGIGRKNDLPWHLPADMKFFKETTSRHIVLMGRKNYDSIPERFRPLPNRLNIILTRNKNYTATDCVVLHSVEDFVYWKNQQANDNRTLFVIGGGEIFTQFLSEGYIDEMYITQIDADVEADTFFPVFDENQWSKQLISTHQKDEKHQFDFAIYHYVKK